MSALLGLMESGLITAAVSLMPVTMWLTHFSFWASVANSTQSPSEFLSYICLINWSVEIPIFLATGVASFSHHLLALARDSFCWVRFMVVKKKLELSWWWRMMAFGYAYDSSARVVMVAAMDAANDFTTTWMGALEPSMALRIR